MHALCVIRHTYNMTVLSDISRSHIYKWKNVPSCSQELACSHSPNTIQPICMVSNAKYILLDRLCAIDLLMLLLC